MDVSLIRLVFIIGKYLWFFIKDIILFNINSGM